MNKVLFASNKMDWETPQWLFDMLNLEYNFTMDVAASSENRKCGIYYNEQSDGLNSPWLGNCWCNPPYGRQIGEWVKKAHNEARNGNATTVMLIPARTDTKYFHDYIYGKHEIQFLKGRLKFSNSKSSAPFPSMIVVFRRINK